jgi:hypothetical protein
MAGLPDFLRHPFGKSAEREANVPPVIEIGGQQIPITIRRLAQSRRMVMRLAPDGSEIRISMPRWGRTAEALAFARSRAVWLETQLARHVPPAPLGDGSTLPFRGALLRVDHVVSAPRRPAVIESTLRLGGPPKGSTPASAAGFRPRPRRSSLRIWPFTARAPRWRFPPWR